MTTLINTPTPYTREDLIRIISAVQSSIFCWKQIQSKLRKHTERENEQALQKIKSHLIYSRQYLKELRFEFHQRFPNDNLTS